MGSGDLTVGIAFLAGLASFLSPCVLALVPAYVGYLSGRSIGPSGYVVENRWITFAHGLAFVMGFSVIFVSLGVAASAIGGVLFDLKDWLARIGGVIVVLFGLHTLGVIHIPFLDFDTRHQVRPDARLGFLSSALMGVFFSAGWAPCVGPVLGAVLTLALNAAEVNRGVILLSAYSMGMAIPFLLAALGIGRVAEWMRSHRRLLRGVTVATGVIMVLVGVLLFTGSLELLARYGFFVDLGL